MRKLQAGATRPGCTNSSDNTGGKAACNASPLAVSIGRRTGINTAVNSRQVAQSLSLAKQKYVSKSCAKIHPRLRQRGWHPQSVWIIQSDRVVQRVTVRVEPAQQTNRIRLRVSPRDRIVIPEVVVSEPGLLVQVLARQYSDESPLRALRRRRARVGFGVECAP